MGAPWPCKVLKTGTLAKGLPTEWLAWTTYGVPGGLQLSGNTHACVHTQHTCIYTHPTVSSQLFYSRVQKLSGVQAAGVSLGSASSGPQSVMGSKQLAMPTRLDLHNLRSSNLCKAIFLPRWPSGQESACQWRKCRFNSWVRKILWRMATRSRIFAWKTSRTEESGGLHGVTKSWIQLSTYACTHTHTHTHTHTSSLLKAYVTSQGTYTSKSTKRNIYRHLQPSWILNIIQSCKAKYTSSPSENHVPCLYHRTL